jgi:hypothetical protein
MSHDDHLSARLPVLWAIVVDGNGVAIAEINCMNDGLLLGKILRPL